MKSLKENLYFLTKKIDRVKLVPSFVEQLKTTKERTLTIYIFFAWCLFLTVVVPSPKYRCLFRSFTRKLLSYFHINSKMSSMKNTASFTTIPSLFTVVATKYFIIYLFIILNCCNAHFMLLHIRKKNCSFIA